MSYVMTMIDEALDTARTGQERAADLGDAAGDKVRKARTAAVQVAQDLKRKAKR
jgi:F0F1-type ATP synthase membrane subunit b/b'